MLPMFTLSLFLSLPAALSAGPSCGIGYPANPSAQASALFVAGRGVARYDQTTGGPVWSALYQEPLHEPLVAGSRLLIRGNRNLYALDGVSGLILWQHRFPSEIFNPVLVRDRVIVTDTDGAVRALSVAGELLWETREAAGWLYPPAVAGNLLITGGQGRKVVALDAVTGAVKWQRKIDQELVYSPLATASGGVVVTTFSGGVFMLKSSDGSELWNARFATPSFFPSIVDRRLLLSEMDGTLRALDPVNGEMIWQQTLPSRLVAPVNGRKGLLLATVDGGEVLILGSDSGAILKHYRLKSEAVGAAQFSGERIVVVTEGRNESAPVPVYLGEPNFWLDTI